MSSRVSDFKLWLIVFFSLILAILIPYFSDFPLILMLWLVFLWVFVIAFLFPNIGIFLIILVRPILDYFGSIGILQISDLVLNVASLFALASVIYVARLLYHQKKIEFPPLTALWLTFLSITFLSAFSSFSSRISISEWFRLLSVFSLYICAYNIFNKYNFAQFLRVFVLSAFVPICFAVYQFVTKTGITLPFEGIYNRIYGTFAHPNLLAYYLVLAISISVFILLANQQRKVENYVFVVPLVIYLVILVLTYTRGAWLALLITLAVVGLMRLRVLLIVLVMLSISSYFLIPTIHSRVNNLLNPGPDSSITWRINLWKDSLGYFKDNPIFGYGTGTSQRLILLKRGEEMGSSDPHNDYLKIALENGIVGLSIYILLLYSLLVKLFKNYLRSDYSVIKTLSLVLLAISLSFVVLGFADNIIRNTALQWAFWSIIGGYFAITPETQSKKFPN